MKWENHCIAPTKSLNSAGALEVHNLHYSKITPLSTHFLTRETLAGPQTLQHVILGGQCIIWNLLFSHSAYFAITKVSALKCLFEPPFIFLCRRNRSFHLLSWKYNMQNIFETLHAVFYIIILLFLIINIIYAHC